MDMGQEGLSVPKDHEEDENKRTLRVDPTLRMGGGNEGIGSAHHILPHTPRCQALRSVLGIDNGI